MEYQQILATWKSYDQQLAENLRLNRQLTEDITRIKVQSFLQSMQPIKTFTILVGIAWVFFLATLVLALLPYANLFFLVSAALLALLNAIAIGIYLFQAILIQQADITEPILATQGKIASLKSSTLWIARILFLQLPLWTIFYWNNSMLENGHIALLVLQVLITFVFACTGFWLFFNIRFENRHKKWFRLIFQGKEWTPLIKSMDLLEQVKEFNCEPSVKNDSF